MLSLFNTNQFTTPREISTRLSDQSENFETTTRAGIPLSITKIARYRNSGCDKVSRILEKWIGQPVDSIDGSKSLSVTVNGTYKMHKSGK